ncbi:MbtH family NRPS accessory protein [Chitinivorax sp. B]|uniref:MbtH family NRPS accessory protein n=1 Tax=Chitinivorax sp. B TaxID=2502235 RepID=UPI0010F583CE|nr:MbtH family NRPS accessory protein [Chitinivorax sp. B]
MITRFTVIRNAEYDYAIHDLSHDVPAGWTDLLVIGSWNDCQAYIRKAHQCQLMVDRQPIELAAID